MGNATNNTEKTMKIQKLANSFARKNGYGKATKITISETATELAIGETVSYGYRKHTTDEYVSNAYRTKFGWKNTYYQAAVCEVIIPATMSCVK